MREFLIQRIGTYSGVYWILGAFAVYAIGVVVLAMKQTHTQYRDQ